MVMSYVKTMFSIVALNSSNVHKISIFTESQNPLFLCVIADYPILAQKIEILAQKIAIYLKLLVF